MEKGAGFFIRYCLRLQKSYLLLLMAGELCQTLIAVFGIVFPRYIINMLFEEKQFRGAAYVVALFLSAVLALKTAQIVSRYYAEKSRDQMYRRFSIDYARQIMESDYKNMEDPEYMDRKEKALQCITSDGFAGIILRTASLLGRLLLIFGTILIVMSLDMWMVVIFLCLIAVNVWINNRMERENAQLELAQVPHKRREEYYYSLGDDRQYAKETRLYGLEGWILKLYGNQFDIVHSYIRKKNKNTSMALSAGSVTLFLQQSMAYGYLIYQVFKRGLSMGSFTMYLNAIFTFNSAITELLLIYGRLKKFSVYFKPFEEFMSAPSGAGREKKEPVAVKGREVLRSGLRMCPSAIRGRSTMPLRISLLR